MSPDLATFAIQFIAGGIAAGLFPFVRFLMRRRGELQQLDRTSAAPLLTSAGEFVAQVVAVEAIGAKRVIALAEQVTALEGENRRLSDEVAALRTDLGAAQGQVDELSQQLRAAMDTTAMLTRLADKVDAGNATGLRNETAAEGVADDLAAAHRRADEVVAGRHGEAADAASRQTPAELDRPRAEDD